jgi:hypothetical protein
VIQQIVVTMDGIDLKIHKGGIGEFWKMMLPPQLNEK